MKHGRLLISECIGKVELTLSSMIPGLQTVLLELNTKPDVTILPNLNVEMRKTESAVILEAPVTNLTKYLIANYETILKSIPISIDSKLRLRDQDKVDSCIFCDSSNNLKQGCKMDCENCDNCEIAIAKKTQFRK